MHNKWEAVMQSLWEKSRFTSYFYQSVDFLKDDTIPTIALTVYLSKMVLLYNTDFIEERSEDELIGLLVHEMLHVINGHDHRAYSDEIAFAQNIAQDMVINAYIKENETAFFSRRGASPREMPKLTLPEGLPVVPDDFYAETGIKDPTWEQVYQWMTTRGPEKLREFIEEVKKCFRSEKPEKTATPKTLPPEADEFSDDMTSPPDTETPGIDRETAAGFMLKDDDGNAVPTGMHMFHDKKQQRQLAASARRVVDFAKKDREVHNERSFQDINGIIHGVQDVDISPWRKKIKSIVDLNSKSMEWKYTTSKFNRRYFDRGIYASGRVYREMEAITVVVDVSASMVMAPGEIEAAFGVIEEMLPKFKVNLLCIDEDIFVPRRKGNTFTPGGDPFKPYPYRRGDWKYIKTGSSGTTFFAPLFNNYMIGHREMLIVISDGYIHDINALKPYKPTLWVISGNRTEPFAAPFGKTVSIKNK